MSFLCRFEASLDRRSRLFLGTLTSRCGLATSDDQGPIVDIPVMAAVVTENTIEFVACLTMGKIIVNLPFSRHLHEHHLVSDLLQ